MKKTLYKYLKISILVLLIVLSFSNITYAIDFSKADDFLKKGASEGGLSQEGITSIGESFSAIGNVLIYIGVGVLVGATAYMGILYLVSSPDKQAKLKEQSIGLVVSAVVIFGAYGIWEIVVNLLTSIVGY